MPKKNRIGNVYSDRYDRVEGKEKKENKNKEMCNVIYPKIYMGVIRIYISKKYAHIKICLHNDNINQIRTSFNCPFPTYIIIVCIYRHHKNVQKCSLCFSLFRGKKNFFHSAFR